MHLINWWDQEKNLHSGCYWWPTPIPCTPWRSLTDLGLLFLWLRWIPGHGKVWGRWECSRINSGGPLSTKEGWESMGNTSASSHLDGTVLECAHQSLRRSPAGLCSSCPEWHTSLASIPSLSHLPTPSLPVLPGIPSRTNYLHLNPCLRVCLAVNDNLWRQFITPSLFHLPP